MGASRDGASRASTGRGGVVRPKRWIAPELDKPVDGELRMVRLEDGTVRATTWCERAYSDRGHYADRHGDGVCSPRNRVVAVGVMA